MKQFIFLLTASFLLLGCEQQAVKKDSETTVKENASITLSADTAKLAGLINLTIYKPVQAKFKYTVRDNSGNEKRLSIPGPSDSYLEVILYFDPATFQQLKEKYRAADHPLPNYDRQQFNFAWLDKEVREELLKSDESYHGHPDFFLGLGYAGKLWLLDNKILLTGVSN